MTFEKIFIITLNFIGLVSGIITIILGLKDFSKTRNIKLINILEKIGKANEFQILLNNYQDYFKTQGIVTDLKKCEISIYRQNKTPWLILLGIFTFLWITSTIGIVSRPLFQPSTFVITLFVLTLLAFLILIYFVSGNITDRTIINFQEKTVQSKSIFGNGKKENLTDLSKLNSSLGNLYLSINNKEYFLNGNCDKEEYEV